jgi:amino acid transporter
MGLDIKIPIGSMFLIFGIILGVFGLFTEGSEIYASSLNINVNLWSGLFMVVFGIVMLLLSSLVRKKKLTEDYGIPEENTK